jgi:hypothetical protein
MRLNRNVRGRFKTRVAQLLSADGTLDESLTWA